MTPSVLVLIVATLPGVQDRIETAAAMAKFHRLAALPDEANLSAEERNVRPALKARMKQLLIYVDKISERAAADEIKQNELFNLLQVERDLVNSGTLLAASPEEALCWQKAGLDLARAYHRMVERRVAAGSDPSYMVNHTRAQVELFRKQYIQALARCIESQT